MKEVKVYERPKLDMTSSRITVPAAVTESPIVSCAWLTNSGFRKRRSAWRPSVPALMYNYADIDFCEATPSRTPATATGLKEVRPDGVVFTYQGDGDLASIGMAEIVHAANRSENITVVFINNAIAA